MVAYAGFPLRNSLGTAIGSVCAIDSSPRVWSEAELRMLEDVASMCSTEIELRESRTALSAVDRGGHRAVRRGRGPCWL